MKIVEISNLTASYASHVAVEKVNIDVKEKEFICLVGENGSGKSTILKSIVGLHKQDKGSIKTNIDLGQISYLEQFNMKELDFPATAKEIIMSGLQKNKGKLFYTKLDYKLLEDVCNMLHIKNILGKRIGELSGGQRQRVMLARAMITKPKLLILDEPCSGLDKKISDKLYDILLDINKDYGTTIITSIHNVEELIKINKEKQVDIRVIHIAREIKFDGKIDEWKGL